MRSMSRYSEYQLLCYPSADTFCVWGFANGGWWVVANCTSEESAKAAYRLLAS